MVYYIARKSGTHSWRFLASLKHIGSVSKTAGRHNCMEEVLTSKMASRHKDSTRIQAWPRETLLVVSCSAELKASKWPAFVSPSPCACIEVCIILLLLRFIISFCYTMTISLNLVLKQLYVQAGCSGLILTVFCWDYKGSVFPIYIV